MFNARGRFLGHDTGSTLWRGKFICSTRLLWGLGVLRVPYSSLGCIRVLGRVGIEHIRGFNGCQRAYFFFHLGRGLGSLNTRSLRDVKQDTQFRNTTSWGVNANLFSIFYCQSCLLTTLGQTEAYGVLRVSTTCFVSTSVGGHIIQVGFSINIFVQLKGSFCLFGCIGALGGIGVSFTHVASGTWGHLMLTCGLVGQGLLVFRPINGVFCFFAIYAIFWGCCRYFTPCSRGWGIPRQVSLQSTFAGALWVSTHCLFYDGVRAGLAGGISGMGMVM